MNASLNTTSTTTAHAMTNNRKWFDRIVGEDPYNYLITQTNYTDRKERTPRWVPKTSGIDAHLVAAWHILKAAASQRLSTIPSGSYEPYEGDDRVELHCVEGALTMYIDMNPAGNAMKREIKNVNDRRVWSVQPFINGVRPATSTSVQTQVVGEPSSRACTLAPAPMGTSLPSAALSSASTPLNKLSMRDSPRTQSEGLVSTPSPPRSHIHLPPASKHHGAEPQHQPPTAIVPHPNASQPAYASSSPPSLQQPVIALECNDPASFNIEHQEGFHCTSMWHPDTDIISCKVCTGAALFRSSAAGLQSIVEYGANLPICAGCAGEHVGKEKHMTCRCFREKCAHCIECAVENMAESLGAMAIATNQGQLCYMCLGPVHGFRQASMCVNCGGITTYAQ